MTNALMILSACLIFAYGFRMAARLDRFVASMKGRGPEAMPDAKKARSFRDLMSMWFSGADLRSIYHAFKEILSERDKDDETRLRHHIFHAGGACCLYLSRSRKR